MPEVYALDLDEELLSHLPIEDSWITLQGEEFNPVLIKDEFVREVYDFQLRHRREQGAIATATVICDEFDLDLRDPETSIGDLIDRLRLRYMKTEGREALRIIVKETKDGDPMLVPQKLLAKGRELAHLLSSKGEVFGTGDYDRAIHRYDYKASQGPGASFGYEELDKHFNGMRGLAFLLGYKKTGKSWQMIQSLLTNVEQGHYPWLYSLELPAEETDMRFRCLLADVPWWKWVYNKIGPEDRKALKEASELIDGLGMYKVVKPPHGQRGIDRMVHTARDAGAGVVLIDQLQYVENDRGKSLGRLNDTGEYFGVLDEARNLSDEGPLYIAHQFGRGAMGAESMPDIALAKGSSAIEEVCTLCLGLWSNKDMRRSGLLEIGTLMARNTDDWASWEIKIESKRANRFEIQRRIEEE